MLYKQRQEMVVKLSEGVSHVGELSTQKQQLSVPREWGLSLIHKDEEFLPIYFGIACAFGALHLLGNGHNKKKMLKMALHLNGCCSRAIEEILKGATQLLGLLVWKMAEQNEAQEWKLEKNEILSKAGKAQAEVAEMRKRREEDAKANEKVVAMFATQEHNWKNERKNLRQQIEALLKDLQAVDNKQQHKNCSECLEKERRISELNEKVSEKEFLMMATVQAAEAEHEQRNQLQEKLNRAEAIVEELREKLSKESEERQAEFRRHKAVFIDFVANQRQTKAEMAHALSQLEAYNREKEIILNENREAGALIHTLSSKITHLEKDLQEKDQDMSTMLKRYNEAAKENQELERELKISKAMRRQADLEVERWKRLCEGKKDSTAKQKQQHHRWRLRSSSANRADSRSDLYTEMKRLQAEEIRSLHIKYGKQVEYLQGKISTYEEKLTQLEASILLHLGHNQGSPCSHDGSKDLVEVRDSLEDNIEFQPHVVKDRLIQYQGTEQAKDILQRKNEDSVTPRVLHVFEDWLKLERATHAGRIEQKHWQELDAFSRQMRVKNERMEALHWDMMRMERDIEKLQAEIESLTCNLKQEREEKTTLEALLIEKSQDLEALKERLDLHQNRLCNKMHSGNLYVRPYEMDAEEMQLELKALKRKLREREREHRAILIKVLEEVESELHDKDYKLAVTEAKLIQVQIQYEQEKKAKQKLMMKVTEERNFSQAGTADPVVEEHESCVKNATGATKLEVEKLSEMIADARDQMMQMENHHEKQLKDLIEQAAKVSKAGCQLRTMKNLLQTAHEKIENSAECNLMSQAFQEEPDHSVSDACFHNQTNAVDKHVSSVMHRDTPPETCNLGNNMKRQTEYKAKPSQYEAELGVSSDHQNGLKTRDPGSQVLMLRNDTRNNSLGVGNPVLLQKSNRLSKGKAISSSHSSTTLKKIQQSRDECYSERQTQRQASGKNLTLNQSVFETKLHTSSTVSVDTSASLNTMLKGDSSWKKDEQAASVSSKVKELEQQLEQLEKMSKPDMSELPNKKYVAPIMIQEDKSNNNIWHVQSTMAPISAVLLLKKQVKRYQSLIEKIDDLCKRMHNKDSLGTVNNYLKARTREQTAAKELFLIETFQLQRYVVATGQKLMAIQQEISHSLGTINNELTFPAILNILESIEVAKSNLKEIQRTLEVRIARIIGDLEGTLACEGILHVTSIEWSRRHKSKARKNKTYQNSKAKVEEDVCFRVPQ